MTLSTDAEGRGSLASARRDSLAALSAMRAARHPAKPPMRTGCDLKSSAGGKDFIMDTPKGLRKPHRIAALIPVVLAFLGMAAFAFASFLFIAEQGAAASGRANAARTAGTEPTLFQPEALFGVGIVLLGLGLAWGLWRYYTRNRANDPVTEEATRQNYQRPESLSEDKPDLEYKLRR